MTAATGIYNVIRTVAGSIGTAIASTGISSAGMNYFRDLIAHNINTHHITTVNSVNVFKYALHARGSSMYLAGKQAYKVMEKTLNDQAYMLAYNRVFAAIALLFILSIPLLLLFRRNKID